jgi:hypothetical protein
MAFFGLDATAGPPSSSSSSDAEDDSDDAAAGGARFGSSASGTIARAKVVLPSPDDAFGQVTKRPSGLADPKLVRP